MIQFGSAETVAANKKATNDQVTTATNDLKTAIDNLEEKSGPNMIMICRYRSSSCSSYYCNRSYYCSIKWQEEKSSTGS